MGSLSPANVQKLACPDSLDTNTAWFFIRVAILLFKNTSLSTGAYRLLPLNKNTTKVSQNGYNYHTIEHKCSTMIITITIAMVTMVIINRTPVLL